jgi:hypothetical protein
MSSSWAGASQARHSLMVPEIDGTLSLRHPDACQALLDAAARSGARIERGLAGVSLGSGQPRTVSYRSGTGTQQVEAPLVIGATVDAPRSVDKRASSSHSSRRRDTSRASSSTASTPFRTTTTAGPCATYPGDDTWTADPYADDVVLIGDAAGYNDPIIGEGLSIAMRDARIVRDLILDGARTPAAFRPYGAERTERMRRLRLIADVISAVNVEDGGDRRARRGWFGEKVLTMDPRCSPW